MENNEKPKPPKMVEPKSPSLVKPKSLERDPIQIKTKQSECSPSDDEWTPPPTPAEGSAVTGRARDRTAVGKSRRILPRARAGGFLNIGSGVGTNDAFN